MAQLHKNQDGFTLIELLVVISIIALLAALSIPALTRAKEQGRRSVCMGHVRQFIMGIQVYANDHRERLPSGLSDYREPEDEHTPILSRAMRDALVRIIEDERSLSCPWLREPFDEPGGWYYDDYGYVLGYNYLGGHQGTPWPLIQPAQAAWISPQRTIDLPETPLVTELNAWSRSEEMTFAPHGPRGAILESGHGGNPNQEGIPSAQIGAAGGHVGKLDGSVAWKHIRDMTVHRGSRRWGQDGCFTVW